MRPNVGSGQQNIEKPVRVVARARMEIVILAASWRFGSEICNLVEERPRNQLYFCHRPNLTQIPGELFLVSGTPSGTQPEPRTIWVGHLFGLWAKHFPIER